MPDNQKTEPYLLTNDHLPSISPHLQAKELTAWTLARLSLSVLLAHKYNLPQTLNKTACNLVLHAFPEL